MPQNPPCVSYLGDTNQLRFPLVLFIGREYNGTGTASSWVGQYCFEKSPKSLFWNRAYCLIDRVMIENKSLKNECRRTISSPIIFSNLLPISIPNSSRSKLTARKTITDVALNQHLENVFNQEIVRRVEIVIISCGKDKVFARGTTLVRSHCIIRKKKLIELPYLGSRLSNADIDAHLSREQTASIRRLAQRWRTTSEA